MTDSQGHAPPGHPGSGHATSGYPGSGHATSGYPGSGHATSGYPGSGYATSGYAGYAGAGYGSGGYGPDGYGTAGYGSASAADAPATPAPATTTRTLLVAAAGAGVLVLGAAVAAAVAGVILASQADDVGREIGAELGRAQTEQMDRMMDDVTSVDPHAGGSPSPLDPVDQFPPVEPGELGPDPVLDAYAADCFAGDLQACDDLFYESPPLSTYEEYASTCGGRVKVWTVFSCTELE